MAASNQVQEQRDKYRAALVDVIAEVQKLKAELREMQNAGSLTCSKVQQRLDDISWKANVF